MIKIFNDAQKFSYEQYVLQKIHNKIPENLKRNIPTVHKFSIQPYLITYPFGIPLPDYITDKCTPSGVCYSCKHLITKGLPSEMVRYFGLQLLDCLEAIHKSQIYHRDIRPSNIVIVKDNAGEEVAMLIDWESSQCSGDEVCVMNDYNNNVRQIL